MLRRRELMADMGGLPAGYRRCSFLQGKGDVSTYFVIPAIDITNKPYVLLECMYPSYLADTNIIYGLKTVLAGLVMHFLTITATAMVGLTHLTIILMHKQQTVFLKPVNFQRSACYLNIKTTLFIWTVLSKQLQEKVNTFPAILELRKTYIYLAQIEVQQNGISLGRYIGFLLKTKLT